MLYDLSLLFKLHEICIDSQENNCQQMSDFKAKMHQIPFRLWLHLRPCLGAYSAHTDLVGFKGAYF